MVVYSFPPLMFADGQVRSTQLQDSITTTLRKKGLLVHDVHPGCRRLEALGWDFDFSRGQIRPKKGRVWRLRFAIAYALHKQHISARELSRLVGHVVSMSLVRRECLCVLSAVYAFTHKHEMSTAKQKKLALCDART